MLNGSISLQVSVFWEDLGCSRNLDLVIGGSFVRC